MKFSLNTQILVGAMLGVSVGVALNFLGQDQISNFDSILYVSGIVGDIFVNLLKMILIPLVFTSICVGIANLQSHKEMHRVWKYSVSYFALTTSIAIGVGLVAVNIFHPGSGLNLGALNVNDSLTKVSDLSLSAFFESFFAHLFVNPFEAMAQGAVLPTVIFAILLGISIVKVGKGAKNIISLLNETFELIMTIVHWIMRIAPIGIMALLIKLVATQDISFFITISQFIILVIGVLLFHGLVILPGLLVTFAKMSPLKYLKGMRRAFITAFATSSSSATLPVTMDCVENNLKVDKDVAGFVLPLGATINMDGTALYEAVAAMFIANLYGIELNIVQQCVVFFTSILASLGAPGIPSAGMVTMVMVLQSVGLPVEAIAILIPIDRFLDALRTTVNVEGDSIGSIIVYKLIHKKLS